MTTPSPAGIVLCVLLSSTLSSDCRAWIPVSLQVISTCTLMMPGFLSPNEVVRHSTPTTHTHSQSLDQVITTHLLASVSHDSFSYSLPFLIFPAHSSTLTPTTLQPYWPMNQVSNLPSCHCPSCPKSSFPFAANLVAMSLFLNHTSTYLGKGSTHKC